MARAEPPAGPDLLRPGRPHAVTACSACSAGRANPGLLGAAPVHYLDSLSMPETAISGASRRFFSCAGWTSTPTGSWMRARRARCASPIFPDGLAQDTARDAELQRKGIQVLRFWNGRLRREKEVVLGTIWSALQERAPHPLPDYCRPVPPEQGADLPGPG